VCVHVCTCVFIHIKLGMVCKLINIFWTQRRVIVVQNFLEPAYSFLSTINVENFKVHEVRLD